MSSLFESAFVFSQFSSHHNHPAVAVNVWAGRPEKQHTKGEGFHVKGQRIIIYTYHIVNRYSQPTLIWSSWQLYHCKQIISEMFTQWCLWKVYIKLYIILYTKDTTISSAKLFHCIYRDTTFLLYKSTYSTLHILYGKTPLWVFLTLCGCKTTHQDQVKVFFMCLTFHKRKQGFPSYFFPVSVCSIKILWGSIHCMSYVKFFS